MKIALIGLLVVGLLDFSQKNKSYPLRVKSLIIVPSGNDNSLKMSERVRRTPSVGPQARHDYQTFYWKAVPVYTVAYVSCGKALKSLEMPRPNVSRTTERQHSVTLSTFNSAHHPSFVSLVNSTVREHYS